MGSVRAQKQVDRGLGFAIEALRRKKLAACFSAADLESRATPPQDSIFQDVTSIQFRYSVGGNRSGKTQLGAREVAWLLEDSHPYVTRKDLWGAGPALFLIVGTDLTLLATEIWDGKIKPLLTTADDRDEKGANVWKEIRQGNTLKVIENIRTGDQVVFLSHADGSEKNRKHMQGYTAHYVWIDEMPSSMAVLNELQLRTRGKRNSRFMATFTPYIRNDSIRRLVDESKPPYSKKYRLSQMDNPGLTVDDKRSELERLSSATQSERNRVLFGDWAQADTAVYQFNYELMTVDKLPDSYTRGWRHVVAVDPANKSKCGFTLWAEDPTNGVWYLVSDEYLTGPDILDPETMVRKIESRIQGYNIARRISDTMAWFTGMASARGITYTQPYNKNNRKDELVKGLQSAMSSGQIKIGRWNTAFLEEIQNCHWKDGDSERMINSSVYHTLDASQYFVDCKPKYEPNTHVEKSWYRMMSDKSQEQWAERNHKMRVRMKRW